MAEFKEDDFKKKIDAESDDFSFLDLSIGKKNVSLEKNDSKELEKKIQIIENQKKELENKGTVQKETAGGKNLESKQINEVDESYIEKQLQEIKNNQGRFDFLKDIYFKGKDKLGDMLALNNSDKTINWVKIGISLLIFVIFVGLTVFFLQKDDDQVKDVKVSGTSLKEGDNPELDGFPYRGVISKTNLAKYDDKKNQIINLGDILGIGVDYYYLKTHKTLLDKDLIEFDVMELHKPKICNEYVSYINKAKESTEKFKDIGIEYKTKLQDKIKLNEIDNSFDKFHLATNDFQSCINEQNFQSKFNNYKENKIDIGGIKQKLDSISIKGKEIEDIKVNVNELENLTNEFFGVDGTLLGAKDNKLMNSLGVEINDGEMGFLIKKDSKLPINVTQEYWTKFPNQKVMQFDIYQGENSIARKNTNIGKLTINGLTPTPETGKRVSVQLSIDYNGILQISATDLLDPTKVVSAQIEKKDNVKGMEGLSLNVVLDFSKKIKDKTEIIDEQINNAIRN